MIARIRGWIITRTEGILWMGTSLSLGNLSNNRVLVGFIMRTDHVSIVVKCVVLSAISICARMRSKYSSLLLCKVVKASKLGVMFRICNYCSLILGVLQRSSVDFSCIALFFFFYNTNNTRQWIRQER